MNRVVIVDEKFSEEPLDEKMTELIKIDPAKDHRNRYRIVYDKETSECFVEEFTGCNAMGIEQWRSTKPYEPGIFLLKQFSGIYSTLCISLKREKIIKHTFPWVDLTKRGG